MIVSACVIDYTTPIQRITTMSNSTTKQATAAARAGLKGIQAAGTGLKNLLGPKLAPTAEAIRNTGTFLKQNPGRAATLAAGTTGLAAANSYYNNVPSPVETAAEQAAASVDPGSGQDADWKQKGIDMVNKAKEQAAAQFNKIYFNEDGSVNTLNAAITGLGALGLGGAAYLKATKDDDGDEKKAALRGVGNAIGKAVNFVKRHPVATGITGVGAAGATAVGLNDQISNEVGQVGRSILNRTRELNDVIRDKGMELGTGATKVINEITNKNPEVENRLLGALRALNSKTPEERGQMVQKWVRDYPEMALNALGHLDINPVAWNDSTASFSPNWKNIGLLGAAAATPLAGGYALGRYAASPAKEEDEEKQASWEDTKRQALLTKNVLQYTGVDKPSVIQQKVYSGIGELGNQTSDVLKGLFLNEDGTVNWTTAAPTLIGGATLAGAGALTGAAHQKYRNWKKKREQEKEAATGFVSEFSPYAEKAARQKQVETFAQEIMQQSQKQAGALLPIAIFGNYRKTQREQAQRIALLEKQLAAKKKNEQKKQAEITKEAAV